MADGGLSLEAQECHFWKMPQEVQDMIFELAYGIKSQYKLKQTSVDPHMQNWGSWETQGSLTEKVEELIVCKDWFRSAGKAWIQAQSIHFVSGPKIEFLGNGLFVTFARDISLDQHFDVYSAEALCAYRSLRRLEIRIGAEHFSTNSKCPWLFELDPEDFKKMDSAPYLLTLRDLKEFRLSTSSYHLRSPKSQTEKVTWKKNLDAFESYAKTFVTRPKESIILPKPSNNSDPKPLYVGSLVCNGTPKMLPVRYYYDILPGVLRVALNVTEQKKLRRMGVQESTASMEKSAHSDEFLPATADELIQMLSMTPQQAWTWIQTAKTVLAVGS